MPEALRLDNGRSCSTCLTEWCKDRDIELRYIQPGKPSQNAFIERLNRTSSHEILDAYLFSDLDQVRAITEEWIKDSNEDRPHTANGNLPPVQNWQTPKPAEMSQTGLST